MPDSAQTASSRTEYRTHCVSSSWLLQGNHTSCVYSRQGEYETTRCNLQPNQPNLNYSWILAGHSSASQAIGGQCPPFGQAHVESQSTEDRFPATTSKPGQETAHPRRCTSKSRSHVVRRIYELMAGAGFLTVHLMLKQLKLYNENLDPSWLLLA